MTPVPEADQERGDGDAVSEAIEALCTIQKDGVAGRRGQPIILRPWQRTLNRHLFARRPDGLRRHRTALIGMPRKNGKSAIGSGYALDGLLFDGGGAEVYSAAAEKEQARIVYGETKRIIEANEELLRLCEPMKDIITVPSTGSIYRVLSAEAYSKEGLNISRALVDELHAHQTPDLYEVLVNGTGARLEPLIIAITTAGTITDSTGDESICYQLYEYGLQVASGEVEDESFFFAWWGAPDEADWKDPEIWRRANPGYGDILSADDLAARARQATEADFRTKRLNQWVAGKQTWLPQGAWERQAEPQVEIAKGAEVIVSVDGSYNNDATGVVVVSIEDKPYIDVLYCWEKNASDPDATVPVHLVESTIRQACEYYEVVEIVFDPARWARSIEALEAEGLPVVNYHQNPESMVPATQRFFEAVTGDGLTHSGDLRLARHVRNAKLKPGPRGYRLSKDTKMSPRKIDLAVCAVMGFDRAARHARGGTVWDVAALIAEDDDEDDEE